LNGLFAFSGCLKTASVTKKTNENVRGSLKMQICHFVLFWACGRQKDGKLGRGRAGAFSGCRDVRGGAIVADYLYGAFFQCDFSNARFAQ